MFQSSDRFMSRRWLRKLFSSLFWLFYYVEYAYLEKYFVWIGNHPSSRVGAATRNIALLIGGTIGLVGPGGEAGRYLFVLYPIGVLTFYVLKHERRSLVTITILSVLWGMFWGLTAAKLFVEV